MTRDLVVNNYKCPTELFHVPEAEVVNNKYVEFISMKTKPLATTDNKLLTTKVCNRVLYTLAVFAIDNFS